MADRPTTLLPSFDRSAIASPGSPNLTGGQSDALNRARSRATGDVVIWLNADDRLVPGVLAAAMAAFELDSDLAFAYGDFDMIDGAGAVIRRYRSSPYSWDRVYARGATSSVGHSSFGDARLLRSADTTHRLEHAWTSTCS